MPSEPDKFSATSKEKIANNEYSYLVARLVLMEPQIEILIKKVDMVLDRYKE